MWDAATTGGRYGPPCNAGANLSSEAMDCTDSVVQESLTATATFDTGPAAERSSATIRFSGLRHGVAGRRGPGDSFVRFETVENILPGSGPIALTTRIEGVDSGEWLVTAHAVKGKGSRSVVRPWPPPARGRGGDIGPAPWWRRGVIPVGSTARVRTGVAALAQVPGTVRGAWATLVGLGVVLGLLVQSTILAGEHFSVVLTLAISSAAAVAGLIGAKAWFLAIHRLPWRGILTAGMCVQGFLVGAGLLLLIALAVAGIPIGRFLDATAPGLLIGMAAGRPGCFLAGCCAGRPISSRWGWWSSDRRVGIRRIPIQLIEALVCLLIGLIVLVVAKEGTDPSGALFVAALAAYTLARQFLLPFRAEPRKTSLGPVVTVAAAALVLLSDVAAMAFG